MFQNKSFISPALDWALDDHVRAVMKEKIASSGRSAAVVEPLLVPSADVGEILATARSGSFDTVFAFLPVGNPHDDLLPAGPGLLRRKLPGVDKLYACNGVVLRVWRVSDAKLLAFGNPNPCTHKPISGVWHDQWSGFSETEQRALGDAIQSYVEEQIDYGLKEVRLLQD